jgi:hypothetical protein
VNLITWAWNDDSTGQGAPTSDILKRFVDLGHPKKTSAGAGSLDPLCCTILTEFANASHFAVLKGIQTCH